MRIVRDYTDDEKDSAQEAFQIAISDHNSEQHRLYLGYLRDIDPNIPEDAVLTEQLMRVQLHRTLERLQDRWIKDYRAKAK